MICEALKAPNDPTYFIRPKATSTLPLAVKPVRQLAPLKAMELQFGYRNSPISYQFNPVCLRSVQPQNKVAGALALQTQDTTFFQSIVYYHVVSTYGFPLFMEVSYVDVYTPRTWRTIPPETNRRPQCDDGLIPAPTTTP